MEMRNFASGQPATPRHQRLDGRARLRFGPRGLADLYQRAPCKLLFPVPADPAWPEAIALTTSGGLTGGDRVRLEIEVDPGACGTVATQAAEKLYRVLPGEADIVIETDIAIGAGGRAEWLAQEAIVFDRSRFRRNLTARLEGDARLLAVESLVLGRLAMGETFASGLIHDEWRIRRDDRLVWADALHVAERQLRGIDQPFRFDGAKALATILYAGPDAETHLEILRQHLPESAGATAFDGMLIARLHDGDPARLKRDLSAALSTLRQAVFGRPAAVPPVWTC